jgi:hypothetical protein
MPAKTVQLPEPVFRELNALKIKTVKSTDTIPTNGDIIRAAMLVAIAHYEDEYLAALAIVTRNRETETPE